MDDNRTENNLKFEKDDEVKKSLLNESGKDKQANQDVEPKLGSNVKCFMVFKTVIMIGVFVSLGMRVFIEFSTLPNLRLRLGTNIAGLAYAMSFGGLGGIMASPLAACADRFGSHSDIIMSVLLVLVAFANGAKPYLSSLIWFAACDFLTEMSGAVIAPIVDSVITSMWGAKAGPPLHAVHAGFTIGALIGPLIASVFIQDSSTTSLVHTIRSYPDDRFTNSTASSYQLTTLPSGIMNNCSANDLLDVSSPQQVDESNIEYAYVICSAFIIFLAVVFFFLEFIKLSDSKDAPKKKSYKWREIFSPSSWGQGNAMKGFLIFIAMSLFYICHLGVVKGPGMLLTTYAVDSTHLNFTGSEAVALTAAGGFGGVIARGILIVISGFVSINVILTVAIHAQLIASVLLLIFGPQSKLCLWIFSIVFGLVTRPIWAAGYQWANEYIILVAFHFAVSFMLSRITDIGQNAMQGYLYTYVAKESVFYISVVYAVLNCLVLYMMLLIGSKYGSRHVIKYHEPEEKEKRKA